MVKPHLEATLDLAGVAHELERVRQLLRNFVGRMRRLEEIVHLAGGKGGAGRVRCCRRRDSAAA